MTALRILGTSRAIDHRGPLQPMCRSDAVFWAGRDREAQKVRERRGRKSHD